MARQKRKLSSLESDPVAEPEINEEDEEEEEEEEGEEDDDEGSENDEEEDDDEEEGGDDEEEEDDDDEEDGGEEAAEEEDLTDRETLRKVLDPFSKEQLIELLKEAAASNPAIVARISASADSDPVHRRIFVHGLGWDCTTETLTAIFRPYGELEDCRVIADRLTGRSKGYGFVLFKTRKGASKALKEPNKVIAGRTTSCQLASKGYNPAADDMGRKVFVSNIVPNVNMERLRAFFAKFGEIEEGPLGIDKLTGKHRGFAVFLYKTPEGCRKALEETYKVFEGCTIKCEKGLEGMRQKVPGGTVPMPVMPVAASSLPPNDPALGYASGSAAAGYLGQGVGAQPAAGFLGQGVTAQSAVGFLGQGVGAQSAAGFLGQRVGAQSSGVGLLNPAAGVSLPFNRTAGTPAGVNTVSPSVIGSYQSQAALQGLGSYQGNQLSSAASLNTGMRSQSTLGSFGSGSSSFLGR